MPILRCLRSAPQVSVRQARGTDSVAANPDRPRSRFFVWSAVVMLVVIALGFGKSFFLRPAFNEKPLPLYLLLHGVTMTVW